MSSSPVRIDPGSAVGPYVIERRLAQGGMSVLYLARDAERNHVVLKMVPDELSTGATRARLQREARALAALDHPGIVRTFGAGEHGGTPWIAMEYVRGIDLKRMLGERGPVAPERAVRWTMQAADALSCAHEAGIVHRDLKPSNLLLALDDQIKIVDFGIAKRRTEPQAAAGDVLTGARELMGTPAYLSPEQLEHGLSDERSDVWALGCVLYELCVGAPPFGRGGSASTVAAILRDEPDYPANVPPAIAYVVTACLRKSSFARVATARELSAMLRDAADELRGRPSERISSFGPTSSRRPATVTPPPMRPSGTPVRASSRRVSSVAAAAAPARGSTGSMRVSASSMPSSRPASGRLKGTALRAGLAWFGATYGGGALTQIVDAASSNLRAMLRPSDPAFGIIPSGWYDMAATGELLDLMERVAAPPDPDVYRNALSEAIAKDNVNGIYRSLFKLLSTPRMLEANALRVWRTYADEGTLVARVPAAGQMAIEIREWTHHRPAICQVLGHMLQNVLRATGYTALILERTACVGEGDGTCAWEGMYLA